MTGLVLAILFSLNFLLFPCEGQISLPSGSNILYGFPGNNVTIPWGIIGSLSNIFLRSWTLLSKNSNFAFISGENGDVKINHQYSPGPFTIIKPSTLILNNVTIQYNGTYRFFLVFFTGHYASEVTLFVAVQPKTAINCSNSITINKSDDLTCVCTSKGGNPPANLTWYKDGKQMGNATYGENKLTLLSVSNDDSGIYTCIGQSYTLKNEKSIEVKINFKPRNTALAPKTAVIVLTCKSEGFPEPSYTITRNGILVSNDSTYTISEVMKSDGGYCTYRCIASNKLGTDSACSNLTIEPRPPTTIPPTTTLLASSERQPSPSGDTTTKEPAGANKEGDGTAVVVWHIVVSLVSGIILGLLLAYIIWCCCHRWCKNRKPERNADAQTNEVNNTTYQELDLSKMNTEDNYQSLTGNVSASNEPANDEESTYTELRKTRDEENKYQSLT